jgi:hypothetical protein
MIKPAKTFFSFRFWKKKDDDNKPVVGRLLEMAQHIRGLSGGWQNFQLRFSISRRYIYIPMDPQRMSIWRLFWK